MPENGKGKTRAGYYIVDCEASWRVVFVDLGLKQPGGSMWIVTDADRREFLKALDDSNKVEVTDWEAKFIADNMGRQFFTLAQMDVIARLYRQYDHKM